MCLEITNSSDVTLPITVSFVDAILTNDQRANEACQTEDRENIFPSYITDYDKNITLEAGEHITIYPLVSFPKDLLT
jgi:hypothetical protein